MASCDQVCVKVSSKFERSCGLKLAMDDWMDRQHDHFIPPSFQARGITNNENTRPAFHETNIVANN